MSHGIGVCRQGSVALAQGISVLRDRPGDRCGIGIDLKNLARKNDDFHLFRDLLCISMPS